MALLDLLGRRWALRVLWELRDGDPLTFRELQSRSGDISSSVLNDRLRELREASIVDAAPGAGYRLTSEGQELLASLIPLDTWAERWAERAGEAGRELTSTSPASRSPASTSAACAPAASRATR